MRLLKNSKTSGRLFFKKWHIEYDFWSKFCHIGFYKDENYVLKIAFPPISLYLIIENSCRENRELAISIHSGCLWWNFWTSNMEWSAKTPKYRNGCFHIVDFLFGKPKYSRKIIEERDIEIPMPEGCYQCHIKLCEDTWTRKWTKKTIKRIDADIPKGIPHEGKGENSWDCGMDGCFGMCCLANSIPEGVGKVVGSVLHDRVRYGGWEDWNISNKLKKEI